jgi:hypothetical protein
VLARRAKLLSGPSALGDPQALSELRSQPALDGVGVAYRNDKHELPHQPPSNRL